MIRVCCNTYADDEPARTCLSFASTSGHFTTSAITSEQIRSTLLGLGQCACNNPTELETIVALFKQGINRNAPQSTY